MDCKKAELLTTIFLEKPKKEKKWFFPKNGGIHFYHNVQAFNVDSRSTLKA